jgi:hypothetical protein
LDDTPEQDRPNSLGPARNEPAPSVDDCVADALRVLAALDSTRPDDMGPTFYTHGLWELDATLRALLRALGADPDA